MAVVVKILVISVQDLNEAFFVGLPYILITMLQKLSKCEVKA